MRFRKCSSKLVVRTVRKKKKKRTPESILKLFQISCLHSSLPRTRTRTRTSTPTPSLLQVNFNFEDKALYLLSRLPLIRI